MTKIKTLPPDSSIQLLVEVESGPQLIARAFARMCIPGGENEGPGPHHVGVGVGTVQRVLQSESRQDKGEQSKML